MAAAVRRAPPAEAVRRSAAAAAAALDASDSGDASDELPPLLQRLLPSDLPRLTPEQLGRGALVAAGGVLALTLLIAIKRVAAKAGTARAQRGRQLGRNQAVVQELAKYLPDARDKLSKAAVAVRLVAVLFWGVPLTRPRSRRAGAGAASLRGAVLRRSPPPPLLHTHNPSHLLPRRACACAPASRRSRSSASTCGSCCGSASSTPPPWTTWRR
jgi:hypothetical protein